MIIRPLDQPENVTQSQLESGTLNTLLGVNRAPETSIGLLTLNEVALYKIVRSSDGKTYLDLEEGKLVINDDATGLDVVGVGKFTGRF